jgi:uncharacterized protein YegP (UPF0339 family)
VAATFEIRSPKAGKYVWVLTNQGRILAISGEYSRRSLAEKAIVPFRMAAVNAPVIDTTEPAVSNTAAKVARATGRVLAKVVVKSGRAIENAEEATARRTR